MGGGRAGPPPTVAKLVAQLMRALGTLLKRQASIGPFMYQAH